MGAMDFASFYQDPAHSWLFLFKATNIIGTGFPGTASIIRSGRMRKISVHFTRALPARYCETMQTAVQGYNPDHRSLLL